MRRRVLLLAIWSCLAQCGWSGEIDLREQELKTKLTVGYAVRLVDMNDDRRLDIVIVDSERLLWLENPRWEEHLMIGAGTTKKDNVCFAPCDIDGDGRIDFAVGADWKPFNTAAGGTIQWLQHPAPAQANEPWPVFPIGEEPTIHRMNWVDLDGDRREELVLSPLMGRDTTKPNYAERGCRLLAYKIPADPVQGPWVPEVINDRLHVCHNFTATDLNRDGRADLLVVSFEGVHWLEREANGTWLATRIGEGDQKSSPNKGASEIKHGRLAGGADYIATIEPWHGNQVVVYTKPDGPRPAQGDWLWNRQVLDDELLWGHAVWCANLDDDEDQELIIGVRDDKNETQRRGLRIYDPQAGGKTWRRQLIDAGGVAIEDLAAGDLNQDGRVDIVAVGRQTHNVKIYWNETK